jgi:ATP-dependent RNA helicase RhlE
MPFSDLNLSKPLLSALEDLGYDTPTPIQSRAFPIIMSGKDVVGVAQTGTGKTLAYLLPLLRLLPHKRDPEPRILIVVPTRELVVQVVAEAKKLTTYMTIRIGGVYGGTNINTQKTAIAGGLDILVGTPGRLMDLALTRVLSLKQIKHFVLDEVDEMLNQGFRTQLLNILDMMPPRRQNLMFSATMTEEVDALIQLFFNHPVSVEPVRAGTPLERIRQRAYAVPNFYTKINLLAHLLKEDASMSRILVFAASKRQADLALTELAGTFPGAFDAIHSNKSQNFRLQAVANLKSGALRGLIATDLLARGIDIDDVTHVVNLDAPTDSETYIHRIGRTGRADAFGESLLFFTEAETMAVYAIEVLMEREIELIDIPAEVILATELIEEEKPQDGLDINYLPKLVGNSGGAFHKRLAKNIKFNKGNKGINAKRARYKKPITRGDKIANMNRKKNK